ncbi:MAG: hypothetical protein QWI73_06950, partial [Alphaproteobacteria bacterium]|nr:hypothetical protein [Alphaproteobacteria bacterium]
KSRATNKQALYTAKESAIQLSLQSVLYSTLSHHSLGVCSGLSRIITLLICPAGARRVSIK